MYDEEELGGADWDSWAEKPRRPDRKEIERIKRRFRMDPANVPSHVTMLETRPAAAHLADPDDQPARADLFGPLWRTGEIAILFGETAVGKSILATQIAESIAHGGDRDRERVRQGDRETLSSDPFRTSQSALRSRKVLYFDFDLTLAQFAERYTCPATKQTHAFSENHLRSVIDDLSSMPEAFRGDATKFLLHSLMSAFTVEEANVAVIDNLAYLTKTAGRGTAAVSLIKNLRQFARTNGLSILILANTVRRPPNRPLSLDDLGGSSTLAHLADSVFALGRSPHATHIRYIKHLKSRNAHQEYDPSTVIACTLARTGSRSDRSLIPHSAVHNPHSEDSSTPQLPDSLSPDSPSPDSPSSFLSFQFHGLYPESDILADPNTRARTALTPQQALQAARNRELIDFLTSPQYARYLKS